MQNKKILSNNGSFSRLAVLPMLLISATFPIKGGAQGIYNSASIVVTGSPFLTVKDGGFHNSGVFSPGAGTVLLIGTSSAGVSTLGGGSPTSFFHLTIGKTTNDAGLSGDISVDGNLIMQSGNLALNQHNIDLGNGNGTLVNENNNARILGPDGGFVLKTADLSAPSQFNPGNIGIAISSASNLGSTLIRRGHQQPSTAGGGLGIDRYFDIIPSNNSALDASLRFFYFDNELAGIPKNELNLYKSEDGGTSWSFVGVDNNDVTADWVQKDNIAQLSRWTLASNINNPLPLTLLSFTAKPDQGRTDLQWVTTSEINSNYFDLQRSSDGALFSHLLSIPAHGTSMVQNIYTATDPSPYSGLTYYRLKEVDLDGHFTFSPIVVVDMPPVSAFSGYPNPAASVLYTNLRMAVFAEDLIGLYDAQGRLLQAKDIHIQPGNNNLQWDLSHLAAGVYWLVSTKALFTPFRISKL